MIWSMKYGYFEFLNNTILSTLVEKAVERKERSFDFIRDLPPRLMECGS
jgi:hypothetical protein